ncbi:MAG: hypothetical protein ACWA6X_06700 [Bauldia sp.]
MAFRSLRIVVAALAALVAAPAAAQAPALTERYQGDGWTIGYPEGWIVLVEAPLLLGNAEGMLATVQQGRDPPEGGIAVGFFPADVLVELGIPAATSVEELLLAVADQFDGVESEPEPLVDWALPAFAAGLGGPIPGETYAVAAKTASGILVGLVVNAASFADVLPIVEAIVASFAPATD